MHTSNNIPETSNQSLSTSNWKATMTSSDHHEQVKKKSDK